MWPAATLLLPLIPLSAQSLPPIGITGTSIAGGGGLADAHFGPSGDIYLAGGPTSYHWSAPTRSFGTSTQINFVSRVDATGRVLFTTAIGGTGSIQLLVDSAGDAFVYGSAYNTGFYTTPGAYRPSTANSVPAFVCRLNGSDGNVKYCTYLDQPYSFNMLGAGVDSSGNFVLVEGQYQGPELSATPGALNAGFGSVRVIKVNAIGSALVYSAAFGAAATDSVTGSAVDALGNVYIAGVTQSADFPTTSNAVVRTFSPTAALYSSTFVSKLSADGTSLLYSTFGIPGEVPEGFAVDSSGEAQILTMSAGGQMGIRRYNSDASAIVFNTNSGISVAMLAIVPRMAIDAAGNTTVLMGLNKITAPLLHPTQTCAFTAMQPGEPNQFMIRLNAIGQMQQATWLADDGQFEDISASSDSLIIAGWSSLSSGALLQLSTLSARPAIQLTCAGNAASFTGGPLAPGEIVSLFGENLGPTVPVTGYPNSAGQYPTLLGATQVTFDGVPSPLLYVATGQINTVVPFGAGAVTTICVTTFSGLRSCTDVATATAAPGIFAIPGAPGDLTLYAAAVNQDGTINSQQNPAARGSIVSLFATGLGPLSSTPSDGSLPGLPLLTQVLPVSVGSQNPDFHATYPVFAPPQWAGQAPFELAGLSQINIVVPAVGNHVSIALSLSNHPTYLQSPEVLIWTQ